jgi:hypothetical protein
MKNNNLNQNNLNTEKEPTNREIMTAVKELGKTVGGLEKKIDEKVGGLEKKIDEKVGGLEKKIDEKVGGLAEIVNELVEVVNDYATDIDKRFDSVENNISWMKSNMVTKDYLDRKMADMKGDLVAMIRDEDKKLGITVETLAEKKVISKDDEKRILSMEPFPKLYV